MSAPKRTPVEREQDLARIAQLHRKGCSERRIAKMLNLSQSQVHYDICQIREQYAKQTMATREAHVNEIDRQLNDLMWEHWRCYFKIKRTDARRRVEKQEVIPVLDSEGNLTGQQSLQLTEVSTTVEERVPGTEHLNAIRQILRDKRELFGTDEPKKVDIRKMSIDFQALMQEMEKLGDVPDDAVEQELAQLIEQIPNLPDAAPQISLKEMPPPSTNGNGYHHGDDYD